MYLTGEGGYRLDNYETTMVDVDDEVATSIALPEGRQDISDFLMLQLRGRNCIYEQEGLPDDYFAGSWDCGGGRLPVSWPCSKSAVPFCTTSTRLQWKKTKKAATGCRLSVSAHSRSNTNGQSNSLASGFVNI
jgi:hypothetical protein